MPVLKFETKLINGKPNISYDTDKHKILPKKKDYKIKNQKYPLRGNQTQDPIEINSKNYENELFSRKKSNEINNKQIRRNGGRNSEMSTPDLNNIENRNNRKLVKPPIVKESLFNFLDKQKVSNGNRYERKSYEKDDDINETKITKKVSLTDSDIDEIMKQVVLENKNLLTEEQLVDVLAKLYLDAKVNRKINSITKSQEAKEVIKKEYNHKIEEIPKWETNYTSNDIQTNGKMDINKITNPMTAPPLTTMQKKQMQWEKERKEMADIVSYNPWGKPGCGAPPKSFTDMSINSVSYVSPKRESPEMIRYQNNDNYRLNNVPTETISQAELKRKQWLTELNEQVAERDRRKMNEKNSIGMLDNQISKMNITEDISSTYGRGRGLADLNQMTTEEMIQKRTKQLEQQEAIRKQIEEKEYQKRIERERNAHLDQEEEARIFREKQQLDTQYMSETARIKMKDDESGKRLAQQRSQLEAAEKSALMDKKMKRLQRLEMAGHDTRGLRAGFIAEQMTGRLGDSFELRSDDSAFNKLTLDKAIDRTHFNPTPTIHMRHPITEDHAVQTDIVRERKRRDSDDYDPPVYHTNQRNRPIESPNYEKHHKSANENKNRHRMRNNSSKRRSSSALSNKHDVERKTKKPEPIDSRKPWGVKKMVKKYVPQSKRDPFYSVCQETREIHKRERVNRILAQVKANIDRIPDKDVNDGRLSQRHKKCDTHRVSDQEKENYEFNHDTYEMRNNSQYAMNDDRVHASVTYKDSYRQPMKQIQSHKLVREVEERKRTAETPNDWWNDPNHEIVRTTDVLNPAMADQRLPISRENTGRERARQGYYKNLNPAQFGEPLKSESNSHYSNNKELNKQDPFYQPLPQPTQRQNTILKQLSDFREGLLLKQKEIETSLSINGDI